MTSFLRRAAATAVVLLGCLGVPAAASVPTAGSLSSDDQADLHRIETYLGAVKTFTADFQQTAQDGSTADGKVFLSRPGKMRFEYQPPAQMLIVSNGDYVAVDDKELKQVQFYPVDTTPVWFLLRESIKLSGDVTVTHLERGNKVLRVTCVQTKDPNAGSITLVFSDQPLALRQWTVVDQQGHATTVALDNIDNGAQIDPALFKLPAAPASQGAPGRTR